MKRIAITLLLLLCVFPVSAMEPAEIMALVAKPHDDGKAVPELEFLCLGREFEIKSRSGKAGEKLVEHQPVISKDKVVDGKYLISEFQPEGTPSPIYNVVFFDDSATVYRQWTLFPGGKVVESLGVAHPTARSITWLYFETPYGPNTQSISIGVLTDEGGSWREVIRDGSKVVLITEGSIRKIK